MQTNQARCLIIPRISRGWAALAAVFRHFGWKVYYRGELDAELLPVQPSDVFIEATKVSGELFDFWLDGEGAKRVARSLVLDSGVLLKAGREALYHRIQSETCFIYQVTCGHRKIRACLLYPMPARVWKEAGRLLYVMPGGWGISSLNRLIHFGQSAAWIAQLFGRMVYALAVLSGWLAKGPSELAIRARGQNLWLASGKTDISQSSEKLSLPRYLEQLAASADFGGRRFAVYVPGLAREHEWSDEVSFSVPEPRQVPPGMTMMSWGKACGRLLRTLWEVPWACFKDKGELDFLGLMPWLELYRQWLESLRTPALVITESAAGSAYALVHAAREVGIPVVMVCYAANHRPVVLDRRMEKVVPLPFRHLLASHFCVWTPAMKRWLEDSGYKQADVRVCGPQMFAPFLEGHVRPNLAERGKRLVVGVFDVNPQNPLAYMRAGKAESIFNAEYILNFRRQVFESLHAVWGDGFQIILKDKRALDLRSTRWFTGWAELTQGVSRGLEDKVTVLPPDSNPWAVLGQVDAVISLPFTSLSEAGLALGRPSVYFDPSGRVADRPADLVPLCSGAGKLRNWLEGLRKNSRVPADPLGVGAPRLGPILREMIADNARFKKGVGK